MERCTMASLPPSPSAASASSRHRRSWQVSRQAGRQVGRLLTTYYALLTTHYSLPTTYYSLPHHLLLTTYYSRLTWSAASSALVSDSRREVRSIAWDNAALSPSSRACIGSKE